MGDTASEMTFDTVCAWLAERGGGWYGGESVTQLQHALQCAALAREAGAAPALVAAALLHDLGHLSDTGGDAADPHERLAARLLARLFRPDVTEPIRLHVAAKRYLCAVDAAYWLALSPASRRSLEWQGGPYSAEAAALFIAQPHAADAVRLRLWDDAAKAPHAEVPPLASYLPLLRAALKN